MFDANCNNKILSLLSSMDSITHISSQDDVASAEAIAQLQEQVTAREREVCTLMTSNQRFAHAP